MYVWTMAMMMAVAEMLGGVLTSQGKGGGDGEMLLLLLVLMMNAMEAKWSG